VASTTTRSVRRGSVDVDFDSGLGARDDSRFGPAEIRRNRPTESPDGIARRKLTERGRWRACRNDSSPSRTQLANLHQIAPDFHPASIDEGPSSPIGRPDEDGIDPGMCVRRGSSPDWCRRTSRDAHPNDGFGICGQPHEDGSISMVATDSVKHDKGEGP
jgi:hypothetical protein